MSLSSFYLVTNPIISTFWFWYLHPDHVHKALITVSEQSFVYCFLDSICHLISEYIFHYLCAIDSDCSLKMKKENKPQFESFLFQICFNSDGRSQKHYPWIGTRTADAPYQCWANGCWSSNSLQTFRKGRSKSNWWLISLILSPWKILIAL